MLGIPISFDALTISGYGARMNKAAQSLGRLSKGRPKHYSAEEIKRRSKILAKVNAGKQANARLVEAARTMLETLQAFDAWLLSPSLTPKAIETMRAKARAAIAKATEV